MQKIVLSQEALYPRGEQIRQLLQPLSKIKGGPAWKIKPSGRNLTIAVHDGSRPSEISDYRFATKYESFRASYYEQWIYYELDKFYLERAYLHIFQIKNIGFVGEKEYLLLHCDPNEPEDANHYLYKKGPHLHIAVAEQPIPHSHIALCLSNLDAVLDSMDSLTEALEWCILMICEQFLSTDNA
jgi:hypothetical protein